MKVVDLVLFCGQSNMAGRGDNSPRLMPVVAFEYKAISSPNELYILKEPFGVDENNPKGINDVFSNGIKAKTGSLVTEFCNSYFDKTHTPIVGVSASKGGSSITEWQPSSKTGYLQDAIERLKAAKNYLLENNYEIKRCFALWSQGETDGDKGLTKREYVIFFNAMWKELHKYVPDLFMIKTGKCNIEGSFDRYETVRAAQDIILNEHKNVHFASDAFYPLREQGLMKDAFHYKQEGYNICGRDAGKRVGEYFSNKKTSLSLNLSDYNKLSDADRKKYIQWKVDFVSGLGGGRVVIPEGTWISGPIHLHSNVELHLCDNAVISFSDIPEDYLPVVFTRWEGIECYNYSPLIYAKDCENVSVTGNGKLIGNGESWWPWKKLQQDAANELVYAESNNIPVEKRIYGTRKAALRPSFIQFINCKNVRLRDFEIVDGPQWTIHPVYCENVVIKHVTINTKGPNTDGLNPDSCKNVWIEKCRFNTGDDCIAVNSGMNEDGWRVNKECSDISIINCKMNGGHGAIVIGSGMSGGVEDIYATNCKVENCMQALRIKSMRGRGGYIKDVCFENIEVKNILEEAIQVSMFYPYSTVVPKSNKAPVFENIKIENVTGTTDKQACIIRGLEDSHIKNLELKNINIDAKLADVIEYVD